MIAGDIKLLIPCLLSLPKEIAISLCIACGDPS